MRLRRTSPDQPGWTRRRSGRGFSYLDQNGDLLPPEARQRVQDLIIPPAWTDVWTTPFANGHLQAVGVDAAGRLHRQRRRRSGDPQLLAYKERNRWRAVLAPLVNDYVREVTGLDATAKDFRTWHATVLAAAALARAHEQVDSLPRASVRWVRR